MLKPSDQRRLLNYFFLATWLVLALVTKDTVNFAAAKAHGMPVLAFLLTAWLSYCVLYLLPAMLFTRFAAWLAHRKRPPEEASSPWIVYSIAVLMTGLTTLFLYANTKLYALYGMFVNGFVVNLIVTPGGIQSLGGSDATNLTFAAVAIGFVLVQALLLALVHFFYKRTLKSRIMPKRLFAGLMAVFLVAAIGERAAYAYSEAVAETSVLTLSESIPFYNGVTARSFFKKIGMKIKRQDKFQEVKGRLRYPLNPLQINTPQKPLNIIWLAAESWRADTMDPEIMPHTW